MSHDDATARIEPAKPPFPPAVQAWLDRTMKGAPPLRLFTTLARDARLFERFMGGGLLDRGNLTIRQREIVIQRVTAQCGSEYEWGVHATLFAGRVEFGEREQRSLVHGGASDGFWSPAEQILLRLCDELHATCTVSEELWGPLRASYDDCAILELLLLAGFYRTVSYVTGAARIPLEPFAARFPPPAILPPDAGTSTT